MKISTKKYPNKKSLQLIYTFKNNNFTLNQK